MPYLSTNQHNALQLRAAFAEEKVGVLQAEKLVLVDCYVAGRDLAHSVSKFMELRDEQWLAQMKKDLDKWEKASKV